MLTTILPDQLATALDAAPPGCAILSLDCFDTLLWRSTHAPHDVFADIGEAGGAIEQRRWAESNARSHAALQRGSNETTIADIYAMLLPNADATARRAGVAAELAAEARHCFAFAPTVALMRAAKERGLKIIIVSDTYLDRQQLGDLIAAAAGGEVAALVDTIFCSSEYGVSKSEGLFRHVLRETGTNAAAILHIGDNPAADLHAPACLGIAAAHLVQFGETMQQRLRMEAVASAILHVSANPSACCQPHRAQLSLGERALDDPAEALGYAVLGPVFAAFDRWLRDEAAALQRETTGRVHLLFLMRDGHLPLTMFNAAGMPEGLSAAPVEISRFTATASSLRSPAAIDRFLERELGAGDLDWVARQLLFEPAECAALVGEAGRKRTTAAFAADIRRPPAQKKIVERSSAFANRLLAHVRGAIDPQPGDTIMLVDLGYNGTVQDRIEPLLRDTLKVQVAGRYLLLREQEISGFDKRGLFDPRHYDMTALNALCGNVAVLEQLCTASAGSTVDYTPDGQPIRTASGVKARQSVVRDRVQQGCKHFVLGHHHAIQCPPPAMTADSARQAAAATLARFMFLPMPHEIAVLSEFQHDLNLGGAEMVSLFDRSVAERELRRQGMGYLKDADRMYLPAELRGHGLPLSLALLAQRRFGLDLRLADFRDPDLELPVLIADGNEVSCQTVAASRTHDGFFTVAIPVGRARFAVGLQFGRLYEWVELHSADFQPVVAFIGDSAKRTRPPIAAMPTLEGIEAVAGQLLRCTSTAGFMMVPPPADTGDAPLVLTVVFRPIVLRAATAPALSADLVESEGADA